tara:strand:- start:2055 stop:3377 length:1323 start_codon:yes stop_codon:yes gene_type:complete
MDKKLAIFGGKPIIENEKAYWNSWPIVNDKDIGDISKVIKEKQFSGRDSKYVKELENNFSRYNKSPYCVAFNSGTAAIHASLNALNIKEGDEVITTSFSFIASALPIIYCNATPVFVDIDYETFNIDPQLIEEKITNKTKAIVIVHFQGLPVEMDNIIKIAKKYKLKIIEDCAQSTGAEYKKIKVGNFGDYGAFSIMAEKQLATCGEGGLVTTNSREKRNNLNKIKMFGEAFDKMGNRFYFSESLGYNYVLNPIQAKFASNKLKEYRKQINKIINNAKRLSKTLEKSSFIIPPKIPNSCKHVFHFYRITVDSSKSGLDIPTQNLRQAIQNVLEREGVSTRHYQTLPLPLQPVFREHLKSKPKFEDYPNTKKAIENTLVIGGNGSAPHYFTNSALIDKYIEVFEKIEENKDKILEYSKKIKLTPPWKKFKGFSDTKSCYFK